MKVIETTRAMPSPACTPAGRRVASLIKMSEVSRDSHHTPYKTPTGASTTRHTRSTNHLVVLVVPQQVAVRFGSHVSIVAPPLAMARAALRATLVVVAGV
eukprot:3214998-Rhodomonas_salina.1